MPSALKKSYPELPNKLSPVFIDESNLVASGTLKEALQNNLGRSKYLIVICSPNSAVSEYVNDEVEYFIKDGRAGNIIPLIVDGTPHSKDIAFECFPPALLELPRENELLGIDIKKFGVRDSFLRVIAAMLELDLDSFISRESRARKKKACIFTLTAAVILIAAGIFRWYSTNVFYKTLRRANNGDISAQYELANMYYAGENVKEDQAEAVNWYTKAAEEGHVDAQYQLAMLYSLGSGVKIDKQEEAKWYLKAAGQGHKDAQRSIGNAYSWGEGVSEDKSEAAKWYLKASEQGDSLSQYFLGKMYINGEGVNQDYSQAVKWLQKSFNQGYKEAKSSLEFALKCQSAVSDDADAETQFEIASQYAAEYKYIEAVKWYIKAANQGHSNAQERLGYIMRSGGFGVERNYSEAAKWYLKAAEQGNLDAIDKIGYMYYSGEGVKENEAEAVKWLTKAAEQGKVDSQFYLGLAYYYGHGIKKDQAKGLEWWQKAADQGHSTAAESIKSAVKDLRK